MILLLINFVEVSPISKIISSGNISLILRRFGFVSLIFFPHTTSKGKINSQFNFSAFNDPSLMQFVHRNLAYLIFLFYLLILFNVYKNKLSIFFKPTNLIGLLLFLQIVLGIFTLLSGAEILLASLHQISSIFLVSSSVYLLYLNSKSN